jgi:exonuclease SbcC
VETWNRRSAEVLSRQKAIADLEKDRATFEGAETEREQARQKAQGAFDDIDSQISEAKRDRAGLFAGTEFEAFPAPTIEAELRRRTHTARVSYEGFRTGAEECAQELDRRRTARSLAEEALLKAHSQKEEAAAQLTKWIDLFNSALGFGEPQLDEPALRRLLEHDSVWIITERGSLQDLETSVQKARAILKERLDNLTIHETGRPAGESKEGLAEKTKQIAEDLKSASAKRAEKEAQIREDEKRKLKVVEVLGMIESQTEKLAVWERVNSLIGAADGKKFRTLAQQLTLDVLLSYANGHLRTLAPRYKLERVGETLGLQVVDQEMGDGVRGVHSLSGGESFLASLALALGLASLSSEKVRVESLFIDEGFGSLDEKTLSVAMDALARLQAHGRKVGVISHLVDMTSQIPVRIEVKKLRGGCSRVVVPVA